MSNRQRSCIAAMAAIGLTTACAASAQAATVAVSGATITYQAGAGEANALTVTGVAPSAQFSDTGATIAPGPGCQAQADGSVACTAGAGAPQLQILTGDRNDRVDAESNAFTLVHISGANGDDALRSRSSSGGQHVLDGGYGDDDLSTATNLGGDQTLNGGPGDDTAAIDEGGHGRLSGASGDDLLSYRALAPGVLPDSLDGGTGNDTYHYIGDSGDFDGFAGRIVPGFGFDTLTVELSPFSSTGIDVDLAACHGCVERVIGSPLADTLLGDGHLNVLLGRDGNDVIDPRGGPDLVSGGAGDDDITTRDHNFDAVSCGAGVDRLTADRPFFDRTDGTCETVLRS
jgi:Ca2+-binding RTX toxin-like protein